MYWYHGAEETEKKSQIGTLVQEITSYLFCFCFEENKTLHTLSSNQRNYMQEMVDCIMSFSF